MQGSQLPRQLKGGAEERQPLQKNVKRPGRQGTPWLSCGAPLLGLPAFIAKQIASSDVRNADETGFWVKVNRRWIHTHSTPKWTLMHLHTKRGYLAFSAAGILPDF